MINNHQTNGHGDRALAEVADQLYAELQVVTRRAEETAQLLMRQLLADQPERPP